MLTAFTLNNFKSFKKARLPLGPLTVLVGANASGKSNAIEGLRLMSWLAQGQKLGNIQNHLISSERVVRGLTSDLAHKGSSEFGFENETNFRDWGKLHMQLGIRNDELHIIGEKITDDDQALPLYILDHPSKGVNTDIGVLYNNFAKGKNKPRITCNDQFAVFVQLETPSLISGSHAKSKDVIPKIARKYQMLLSNMLFLDPIPARMRGYSFMSEKKLSGDGSNLSSIIFNIFLAGPDYSGFFVSKDSLAVDKNDKYYGINTIYKFIQSLPEQDIAKIEFIKTQRGEVMLKLIESFGGEIRDFDATLLSDGTLRVLAIAAAMLSAKEESLVVIEEIDNGVHPSRAGHLLANIQEIAKKRKLRVLISTHNPALLDALPVEAVPDVVFCYRNPKTGDSELVRLADIPDSPELLAQGTVGHLMTNGILDRFVKTHPGPEEKLKRDLAYLEKARAELGGGKK